MELLAALGLQELQSDDQVLLFLQSNGFCSVDALDGITKPELRELGLKYGTANLIYNAVQRTLNQAPAPAPAPANIMEFGDMTISGTSDMKIQYLMSYAY
jgi:hypothetical protein